MMDARLAQLVVAEARSWIGTPYRHMGATRGVCADCIMFMISVFSRCGVIGPFDPRPYPPDWHLHRSVERYLNGLRRYCETVDDPLPGDIATYRFGRCVSHAGIVTDAGHLIHAWAQPRQVEETELAAPMMATHFAGYWRITA